jgi:hypothetical protein
MIFGTISADAEDRDHHHDLDQRETALTAHEPHTASDPRLHDYLFPKNVVD